MKNKLFISIILIFIASFIKAQELKLPTNIQSPNAASLGKYGDVPVSYFTGTPNINIPLHKLSVKGIDLDISLSYDASGIRINSHPGWVGQNWTLNAGGVITRSVIGLADEIQTVFPFSGGYFNFYADLNETNLSDNNELLNYANDQTANGRDYQPDIFFFNFMGISGKFFLDQDRYWRVVSESNIKVYMEPQLIDPFIDKLPEDIFGGLEYPGVIAGFVLTDDQGTIYKFGYNENATEYSMPFFKQIFPKPSYWVANAWYLTEVIDKHGNEIYNFNYERDNFTAQFYRNTGSKRFSLEDDCNWWEPSCLLPACNYTVSLDKNTVDGNLISPIYLTEITTFFNERIYFGRDESSELKYDNLDFIHTYDELLRNSVPVGQDYLSIYYLQQENQYNDGPRTEDYLENLKWFKLNEIKIHNSIQQFVKKIEFNYNNSSSQRLNLSSIDIYGSDGNWNPEAVKYSYSFGYEQFDLLPKYLSKEVDHWGFFNNHEYTIDENDLGKFYSERESDSFYTKVGLLNFITYPTGGYSSFNYEPNEFAQIVSNDRSYLETESGKGAGVRIKKIVDFDGKNEVIRSFKYILNYENNKYSSLSSGILTCKPKYYWSNWHVHKWDAGYSSDYYASTFSINSMIPLSNIFGVFNGYSEVIEERQDGSFTLYKYSNWDNDNNFFFDEQPINTLNAEASRYHPYNELGILRGKLIEVKQFDNNSNLVKKRVLNYRTDHSDMKANNYVLATDVRFERPCNDYDYKLYTGNAYKIYYFDYDIVEEITSNYLEEEEISETVKYTKEDIVLPDNNVRLTKNIIKTNSEGNVIASVFSYPLDLSSESYMQNLIDNNRIGEIIQTETTKEGQSIGAKKTTYKQENGLIVAATVETSKTNISALETEVEYDKYDSEGNLLQYHDKSNINTCFIWGYKNQYPIAKIENAEYTEFESFISSIQSTSNSEIGNCFNSESCPEQTLRSQLNNLRDNIPNAMITSYTYDPAIGVTSITQPNKIIEYYRYDEFNRLQKVFDYKENFVKRHEYNFIDRPYIGLSEIEYDCPSLELGSPITFYTKRIVGVGNLSWIIKSEASVLDTQSGSAESFATRLTNHGVMTINCSYTDESSYKTVSKELKINVSEVFCKFVDIQIGNPYTQQPYAEAYVQCPLEDVVRLSMLSMNTSGADFYIGDTHYRIEGYGSQIVEVPVGNQSKLKCRVEMSYDSQGYSSITIQGLENNTTQIGSPYIIEPVVRQ
ncbi:MAG TPA: hypothetical protein DCG75_04550 [Bacteroidales bacterium]|nr:hypothetical protein [Bacteroidales bacterium]